MIGFDLDGVFVTDIVPTASSDRYLLPTLLEARKHQLPLFLLSNLCALLPSKNFVLVTARPSVDTDDTVAWCLKHLTGNIPEGKFTLKMRSDPSVATDKVAAEFKASVILKLGLSHFVESSLAQVQLIRQATPNCKVIHFSTLVEDALSKELE